MFNRNKIEELEKEIKHLELKIKQLEEHNSSLFADLQEAGFRFKIGDEVSCGAGIYLIADKMYKPAINSLMSSRRVYILIRKGERTGWIEEADLRKV